MDRDNKIKQQMILEEALLSEERLKLQKNRFARVLGSAEHSVDSAGG